ncbi:DMT family transporter [Candidatus Woesearchaeota archaeon]|nr:DMT family transporter [Candidatus Woesearchaeota archaeon]
MKRGYLFVLLTALVSGISIYLNKFAVSGLNPYVFTWSKNILVAVFLFAAILLFRDVKTLKNMTKAQWGKLAAIGLIGGSVPFLLFFKGLSMAPSATASLLHKSMFIFIAIMAVMFLKEKLSKAMIAAAVLLFAGNIVLLSKSSFGFGIAEALIMIAVLFWSAETIISKHVLKELPSRIVAFGRMFFGSLFILVFLGASGNLGPIASFSAAQLGWIAFTAVLLLLYVTTWYAGLKLVSASRASCILVLGSAVTTILTFIDAGTVTIAGLAGTALILSGTILVIGYSYIASRFRMLVPSKN